MAADGRLIPATSGLPPAALFDQLPDGVWRFDARHVVVYVNGAAAQATAIARQHYLGRRLGEIEHFAPFAPLWDSRLAEVFESFEGRSFKFTYRHPTGLRNFEVRMMAEAGADGEVSHVTAFARDITVPRSALRQLQLLLAESRLLFDTALVGLLFVREGRLVRVNAAMEELLGLEAGTLADRAEPPLHAADRLLMSALAERYDEIGRAGACDFELLLYRRRGAPVWVAVQGRAVNRERPELGFIFAFADIDRRKRSEHELQAAAAELQLIFDNALVGIVYVANDLVVKANEASQRLFGLGAADLGEVQFGRLFIDPGAWPRVQRQCEEEPGAAAGVGFELPMRRADGGAFWCAGNVRPLERGTPERGMIVALTDVTERAAAERQRLDEALRQRDLLVREVHHRIKNNLQGVAGLLQQMGHSKPEVAPALNEVAGQIQAIAQVHGLKIGTRGTLPVLGVVEGIFRNLANTFGVQVRRAPSPAALAHWGLPENEAVPLALVINELGTNAMKYRARREFGIEVAIEEHGPGLALSIANPGRLPAGFDFDRVASGVSGLALVKALLPRRGARLAITGDGEGVCARLELAPPAILAGVDPDQA